MTDQDRRRYPAQEVIDFVIAVLMKLDVPADDARVTAEVLVESDLRGIESHGVARLFFYVWRLKSGLINPHPEIKVVRETPCTALIDGDDGLGQVVSTFAMNKCIELASKSGLGLVTVGHSNHFGIAGVYPMMALENDMIGLALTNAHSLVAPTFGVKAMFGTNPISIAFPAGEECPYVLDMATSTVPFGKIEEAVRNNEKIPAGWGMDRYGNVTEDPAEVFQEGILMPLGGPTELGGHKGYGLGIMVDILSSMLSGADYGPKQEGLTGMGEKPSNVGHLFGAAVIDNFVPLDLFKTTMDAYIREFRACPKQEGQERVYIHGEIEFEHAEKRRAEGIPLNPHVVTFLNNIAEDLGMEPFSS